MKIFSFHKKSLSRYVHWLLGCFLVSLISAPLLGYTASLDAGRSFDVAASGQWEEFRRIRLDSLDEKSSDSCQQGREGGCSKVEVNKISKPTSVLSSTSKINNRHPRDVRPGSWAKVVQCPASPTSVNNAGFQWYLCDLDIDSDAFFSPYGLDYPLSYMTPKDENFTPDNPARIRVYMHPDDNGSGAYVNGASSFARRQDTLEIHPVEQQYGTGGKYTGWWVYSGNEKGAVANYNGRQIAASIDFLLERYADRVDLNKGIYLVGKSLGGAGAMHQSMVLPKYQNKIAIVDGIIALMMIPKNHERQVKKSWGKKTENPDVYDSVDIRTQWQKIQDIHFFWRGGQNDNYDRFDMEFIDICEKRKISCSLVWLRSGHSTTESGYNLDMSLFSDPNQDVTLDKILPVITNNTSNYHGELRGYHNRGVTWNQQGILESPTEIRIPLQYKAMRNLGPELPDQPDTASFSVTPRHVNEFSVSPGNSVQWQFGKQKGISVVAEDGLITINGLKLNSGTGYKELVITRANVANKSDARSQYKEAVSGEDIIYTRVPRTTGSHRTQVAGADYLLRHADVWDTLPEVARQFSHFNAPGQLVYRHKDGTEEVIFDCSTQPTPCVPLDPSVSLDGNRVAFSVYRAANLESVTQSNLRLPNRVLGSAHSEAQVYIYDKRNGSLTAWPRSKGVHDIGPVWLPDGRMMFGSDRGGFYAPFLNKIGTSKKPEPRLFIADVDGNNVIDITPHEVTAALHPYLLNSGRVAYSSQWLSHNLAYNTNNGGINWPGTTSNFWSILDIDSRGGDMTALLGAHRTRLKGSNPRSETVKALHFIGQRQNNDICTVNYYRANNLGLGDVVCWPPEPVGVEGKLPNFVPRGLYSVASWSTSEDAQSRLDSHNNYLGKVGWPEGTSDNQLILSVGRGFCTRITARIPGTPEKIGERTGCDVGLYKTTVIPSRSPDDLQKIVDKPEWHEFGARVIRPREIAKADFLDSGDGSCQIASSDAGATDALHYGKYDFNKEYRHTANNGSLMEAIDHGELAAIRFYQIIPNIKKKADFRNSIGNKVKLLGDVPLLADKSFKAQLPCDVPYIMAGVDAEGRLIKRDQIPQSLRPGEKRVCTGCHLHSEKGRPYERSLAFTAKAVPLLTGLPVPTYEKDIKPIFQAKCVSCHNQGTALFDYEKLVWDYFQQSTLGDPVKVVESTNNKKAYGLQRPYTSKYVNSMYARESLLYWKAANKRTDGRQDGTYSDDIDFGPDHPTDLTPDEIKLIGDWLDSGAAR